MWSFHCVRAQFVDANVRNGDEAATELRSRLRLNVGFSTSGVLRTFFTHAAIVGLIFPRPALAGPEGGTVVSGSATITSTGPITDINQSTQKAIINWQGFSVAPSETVNFHQPDASSITLNRVIGNESSIIAGALNANGQVFIVNSNGVLFTSTASVNVGGLVASTLDISNNDFLSGNYVFSGSSTKSVVNKGSISATQGGYVSLMGQTVSNQGYISATLGTVALASGKKTTLNFGGNSLVDVAIDEGVLNALVENKGLIKADGGKVIMTARAADAILSAQVNNTGIVQARTMSALTGGGKSKGSIKIHAYGGKANIKGKLDASAPEGGDGGFVETSGDKVTIDDDAIITTSASAGANGLWLIDPTDFTITLGATPLSGDASEDGDGTSMTGSRIGSTTLQNLLATTNVKIVTSESGTQAGDINVNAPLSWSTNTLTLAAHGDINVNGTMTWSGDDGASPTGLVLTAGKNIFVNNTMTMTGAASFDANFGHVITADGSRTSVVTPGSGATPVTGFNADGTPYGLYTAFGSQGRFAGSINIAGATSVFLNGAEHLVINDAASLQFARSEANSHEKNYVLGADIAFTTTNLWASGFGSDAEYEGSFNGFGHVVTMAAVTRDTPTVGLFAATSSSAVISNVGVAGTIRSLVAGKRMIGALADSNAGTVANSFSTTTIYGINVGGLVGDNSGLIANSYQSAAVSNLYPNTGSAQPTNVGGIAAINSGTIRNSFVHQSAVGNTNANNNSGNAGLRIGGLVGTNSGRIENSYSTGNVATGNNNEATAGGFVGLNSGTIINSYSGQSTFVAPNGTVVRYGAVTGRNSDIHVGGFVGDNAGGTIDNSYAATTTAVNFVGPVVVGGFAGANTGTITNAYYDQAVTGRTTDNGGAVGLLETEAKQLSNYGALASSVYWGSSADGHPILATLPVYVHVPSIATLSYGASGTDVTSALSAFGFQWSDTLSALGYDVADSSFLSGSGYLNAGSYGADAILSAAAYRNIVGAVTVSPKALTFASSGIVTDKIYDGTTVATIDVTAANNGLIGLVGTDGFNVIYSHADFADKNAGNNKVVVVSAALGAGQNGADANNYTIADSAATRASITPAALSATYLTPDKVYDGTTAAIVTVGTITGLFGTDDIDLRASGLFADPNAASNKSVIVTAAMHGADAGNYILAAPSSGTASITPRALELMATQPKGGSPYIAASNMTITNLVSGDAVSLSGSGFIAGTSVGTYDMSLAALTASGNANYTMAGSTGIAVIYQSNLPVGGSVVYGDAAISTAGSTMTVAQTSNQAIINWQSFDVGSGYSVAFDQTIGGQANPSAVTLNRVIGNEESVIAGAINAPGHVYIVNSAGILLTSGSQVNVGALVASTQNMLDSNFIAGNYQFGNNAATGWIEAYGSITTADNGFVALLGNGVDSKAMIKASGGRVLLVGGSDVTLALDGNRRLAGVDIVTADKWVDVGGTIDVSSTTGAGGIIETAGFVSIAPDLHASAGSAPGFSNGHWLMRAPGDFNVSAQGNVSGSGLSTVLGMMDAKVVSETGDVNIADGFSWSSNTLSLISTQDINVRDVMTATGTASLFASYGQTSFIRPVTGSLLGVTELNRDYTFHGINMAYAVDAAGNPTDRFAGKINFNGTGTLTMGSAGSEVTYTVINTVNDLLAINNSTANLASNRRYALGSDLDLSAIADWTSIGLIGGNTYTFDGVFNGLGHVVSNLTSSRNGLFAYVGLALFDERLSGDPTFNIGTVPEQSGVSNLGVVNASIDCTTACTAARKYEIGALAGATQGHMTNVFSTGTIKGRYTPSDNNRSSAGGLYGYFGGYANNNYSKVNVSTTGFAYVGGFAGEGGGGFITASQALGNVAFDSLGRTVAAAGGFIGWTQGTQITLSSASGNVTAKGGYVGGFAGDVQMGSMILQSTASGAVHLDDAAYSRTDYAGGFVGMISDGSVAFSYSSGAVTSVLGNPANIGGFSGMVISGLHAMSVGNSWNVATSGISTNGSGNYEPNHDDGSTPVLDAYNDKFGTTLTAAQFHGGAVGVDGPGGEAIQQQLGDTSALAKSTESVMNGGSPIATSPGNGSGSGTGGGSAPSGPTPRPTRTSSAPTPQQFLSTMGAASVSATTGVERAHEMAPSTADAKAGSSQTQAKSAPKLEDHVDLSKAPAAVTALPTEDELRRRKKKSGTGGAGSGYGASIESIEVDGQRFDLQKEGAPPSGGQNAPASPPAQ